MSLAPISLSIACLRSSNSDAAFFGSFGLAGGGAFPDFFLVYSACLNSSYAFFLSSSSILFKAFSSTSFLFFSISYARLL
jgi:hypothetical protein